MDERETIHYSMDKGETTVGHCNAARKGPQCNVLESLRGHHTL
jgi:hypothetical protein